MRFLLKKRSTWLERCGAAVVLSLFSFVVGRFAWTHSEPKPQHGFLIKHGNQYVVAWKPGEFPVEMATHESLADAVRFARNELKLHSGYNPRTSLNVEHAWLRSDNGQFRLYWKSWEFPNLNRLTFQNERDALYFYNAFRSGAYTGSPIGHAIALVPVQAN